MINDAADVGAQLALIMAMLTFIVVGLHIGGMK